MTHNIHHHIINALQKKKKNLSVVTEKETTVKTLDDASKLEASLDNIISDQREIASKALDEKALINEYKQQFNTAANQQSGILNIQAQNKLHQEIIQKISEEQQLDLQSVQQICDKKRNKTIKIHQLCHHIHHLRESFIHLQTSLNQIPLLDENTELHAFFENIINNPHFQEIKPMFEQVISKGIYLEKNKKFTKNLLDYLKDFLTMASRNYFFILKTMIQYPLPDPFKLADMKRLAHDLVEYHLHFQRSENERYIQLMINHLSFQITAGQQNITLAKTDFSEFKLNQQEIKQNLVSYQDLLNTLGNNRIILLTKKTDVPLLIQTQMIYQKINLLKVNVAEGLNNLFSTIEDPDTKNYINQLSKKLNTIDKIIKDISKDFRRHHVLSYNLEKGELFTQKNDDALYSSTFSLLGIIDPIKLLNGLIDNAASFTPVQQEESLKFLKNLILADTSNTLISIKPEKSKLMDVIELFCLSILNLTQNETMISLVDEISKILKEKVIIKEKHFSDYLNSISKGMFPQTHLTRRLNTINEEFQDIENLSQMEEYLIEVNFILDAPNLIVENEKENQNITHSLEKFCAILSTTQFSTFSKDIKIKINEKLKNPIKNFELQKEKTSQDKIVFDLKKLFHEITHEKIMVIENEKLLQDFFKGIKSGFAKRLTMIDSSELRELAWKQDKDRMLKNLLPLAANSRIYYQYFNAIIQYFTLSILCKIEESGNSLQPRTMHEVKQIYEFIEKAVLRAIEDGAIATSIAFSTILDSLPIKRLGLGNSELERSRKSRMDDLSYQQLSNSIFVKDFLPYLGTIQSQVENEYLRKAESEFEKRVLIGSVLRTFEDKKQSLMEEGLVKNDLIDQICFFMKKNNFIKPYILKDDLLIDNKKISKIALQLSNELKPDVYKKYNISEFKSLHELHERLIYWHQRMEDFHLTGDNPEKQIIEFVEKIISQDSSLNEFKNSLDILNLIFQINQSKNRVYKNFDHDLYAFLKLYYNNITQLLKSIQKPNDQLDRFFSIYNHENSIKTFQENVEKSSIASIPFSQSMNLKKIIEHINHAQIRYNKVIEVYKKSHDQQIYSELLSKVLEGENQQSLLHFKDTQKEKTKESVSLLPESEFPVPQAEPEHPNYIGINRTMNFNPAPYRSTLALFETNELIKDFLNAFPWGAQMSTLNKMIEAKHTPGCNLIAFPGSASPEMQLLTMNYILLSLDCLGKLTGTYGEYALQNFDKIKIIADELKEVAELLLSSNDQTTLTTKIDLLTFKLITLNQDLEEIQALKDPLYPVRFNNTMNEFCHINQFLIHKLLGLPLQKSLLSPLNPRSTLLKKVKGNIKEDLIKYHCRMKE